MAKINLDILKGVERSSTSLYTDLKLDLQIGRNLYDELERNYQSFDIETDTNLAAIKNSFISILTTSPGEKILAPTFGINFGDLLFLPVTQGRGTTIGEAIVENVRRFEPRITILGLEIIANEKNQDYTINFTFTIPQFNDQKFTIKGELSNTGFYTSQ
jgi:phage baseplate assembly protein W